MPSCYVKSFKTDDFAKYYFTNLHKSFLLNVVNAPSDNDGEWNTVVTLATLSGDVQGNAEDRRVLVWS